MLKVKQPLSQVLQAGLVKRAHIYFQKEGANIVVADINESKGQGVVEKIVKEGGKALFVRLDVSNETDWEDAIAKTLSEFQKLDVLVNNAGIQYVKELEDIPLEDWRRLMSVCLDGVFLGTKYAIRAHEKERGRINYQYLLCCRHCRHC